MLYKTLLKNRTTETESKCKVYKNKLTKIPGPSKNQYYSDLIEQNKNNAKGTWDMLNTLIEG